MKWPEVALGELLKPSQDSITIDPSVEYREVTVKLWGKGVVLRRLARGSEIGATRRFRVREGQFILSRIDARNGAFGLVPPELDGAVVSNDFPVYNENTDRLYVPFLGWFSKSRAFVDICLQASEGTTNRVRLKEDRFLSSRIPLPPLTEQMRIAAAIGSLRQATTRVAASYTEAKVAVESIQASAARARFRALSEKYEETSLGQLLCNAGYGSSEKCSLTRSLGSTPVLRIPNVAAELIDLRELKYAQLNRAARENLTLAKGDLLIVRTNGSRDLVGRTAVVDDVPEDMAFASYLIRMTLDANRVLPHFVQHLLRHLRVSGALFDFARTTAGQYNVSLGRLRTVGLPIPPLAVQQETVDELDALQAKVDDVKRLRAETARELDALLPAILDRAFRGEL